MASRSTIKGDTFQVQIRLEPEGSPDSSVSIITQIAVQVGTDRVTFVPTSSPNPESGRAQVVWVNGAPVSIGPSDPVFTLPDGTVTEVSSNEYTVVWNTGESVTINPFGDGMGLSVSLSPTEGPGSVQGLFGSDTGEANDIALPDGTVLPQPVSDDDFYQEFADAWRVTQATSLFDYGPGQSTATFTDTQYPREVLTLADFPPDLVSAAAALAAAAGITDPSLAAAAEFDYISMGDPAIFAEDAAVHSVGGTGTTPTEIVPSVAPAQNIGVIAVASQIVEDSGGATPVVFNLELSYTATQPTVVEYSVVSGGTINSTSGQNFFTADDFGGVLPSGSVTFEPGESKIAVTIDVPNLALGGVTDKWLQVAVASPDGYSIFAPAADTDVVSNTPVAGLPAKLSLAQVTAVPAATEYPATLLQTGNDYVLNLGHVLANETIPQLQLAIANLAAAGGDSLSSVISSYSGTGFLLTGSQPPATIGAGSSFDDLYLDPDTSNLGNQEETVVITSRDVNQTGYSAVLPNTTLTATDTVIAPAVEVVNAQTITFPGVRAGTAESQTIGVTNDAAAGAANLDVTLTPDANSVASGSVSGLAPGGSDDSDLSVGLATGQGGLVSGTVAVAGFSDLGNGVSVAALPSPTVVVTGAVYRLGTAGVSVAHPVVHVGDSGVDALAIKNIDPADGYSENLIAELTGSSGPIAVTGSGSTGEIAAGAADTTTYGVTYSTAQAGTLTADVSLAQSSDGGTGAGSIDGFGLIGEAPETLPFSVQIDNYATTAVVEVSGGPAPEREANGYTLDFGTIQRGFAAAPVVLGVDNAAVGTADALDCTFANSGASAITLSGFGGFNGLAAGSVQGGMTVGLDTTTDGVFTQSVTLYATGTNAGGYSGALTPEVITITGTVEGNLASASTLTPNPVDFGNVRVGTALSQTLSLTNTAPADAGNEALDASFGATTGAVTTNGGTISLLAPAATDATGLAVGLPTATDGVQSGTAVIDLVSDGTGVDDTGTTILPAETVAVTGTVWSLATPIVTGTTLDFGTARTGNGVAPLAVSIANGTSADPYQEGLQYSLGDLTSNAFFDDGYFDATVGSGQTLQAEIGLNADVVGAYHATGTLFMASTGAGTSLLGLTDLPSQTITLSGTMYETAQPEYSSALDFGIVHVGDVASQVLSIANLASGPLTDTLIGGIGSISGDGFSGSGDLGLGLASGAEGSLDFALDTAQAGTFSGAATLALASHDTALADAPLSLTPVALSGTVDNYATAAIVEVQGGPVLTGSASAYALNLGVVGVNGYVPSVELGVENTASGTADALYGSFAASSNPAITLSGLTPFSGLAASAVQGGIEIGLNTGSAGVFTTQVTLDAAGTNASGYDGTLVTEVVTITGTVDPSLASAAAVTPNPVDFANVHTGAVLSRALTVTNAAPSGQTTETLDGSIGNATGAATDNGGAFTGLAAQQSDTSSLTVGLATTTSGVQSGNVTVSLDSSGTMLPSQTVAVTGTVYAYAQPIITGTTLNFGAARVGGAVADRAVTIANGTTATAYQENLVYNLHNPLPAGFEPVSFQTGTVAAGQSAQASVTLDTSVAGNFSGESATLSLDSSGAGTSGLPDTGLPSQTVMLNGKVYAPAVPQVPTSLDFGIVHVGASDTQSLSVANAATGALTDVLVGNGGVVTGAGFSTSGNLGAGVTAGASGSLTFSLATSSAGVFTGSAPVALASHDADLADQALSVTPVALTGTVDNYATAAVVEVSGSAPLQQSGSAYSLDLGQVALGASAATVVLGVENTASGVADVLNGTITESGSGITVSGLPSFSGLVAGDTAGGLDVTLDTAQTGVFTEQVTLSASGSNASLYSGALAPEVVTITGTVVASAAMASASTVTPNPVNFGNVHVGATLSQPLTIGNTAPTSGAAETLDGSIGGASGSATTNGGSFTGLAADVSSTSLAVGLSTAADGVKTGSATITLASDGTGVDSNGITPLPSQTVERHRHRLGAGGADCVRDARSRSAPHASARQSRPMAVSIADGNAADPYQESLAYNLQNTTARRLRRPQRRIGTVVSGSSAAASLVLNTTTAGSFSGTAPLSLTSTGVGTSGLADTRSRERRSA